MPSIYFKLGAAQGHIVCPTKQVILDFMDTDAQTIFLETELRPNASLSPRAFAIVMTLVGVFSFAAGVLYFTFGAWPVFGFFGLDALAIWYAFRVSFKDQDQVTYVRVDETHVRLWHVQSGRDDKTVDLPTAFVRVELDTPVTHNSFLRLEYGARAFVIGRFLTPEQREDVAAQLRTAINASRNMRFALP